MPGTKASLLIVDDEPSIRESLLWVLIEIGYSVRVAEDGLSALIEIRKEIPDMILFDLNMPGMSGFEIISVVRRRLPAIPVIAMSGTFSGDEAPSGLAADAFQQKGSDARTTEDHTEWGAPPPEQVIAHTNLYWINQAAPGQTADTVETKDVDFTTTA